MPGISISRKVGSTLQLIRIIISIVFITTTATVVTKAATIVVPSGGDFQAALNTANCGDTIVLQAGGSYVTSTLEQPFVAKAKGACTGTSADFITVQGSNFSALPVSLKDLSITQINALTFPKLVTKVSTPALEFQAGSHHYRFVGVEITNDSVGQTQLNNGLVFVGDNSGSQLAITLANVPHDIEFDRCYVHSEASDGTTSEFSTSIRGFSVSAKNLTIKNSRIAGFRGLWKPGQTNALSSNAILINKGPGPYTFTNNYLEAWFGTVFTGGMPQWVVNQASVAPGATTTQATLTNVVGTLPAVGDYIAFLAPNMTFTVGVFHGQPYEWGAAKVTAVNGNTITYVPQASNNVQSAWGTGPGGTPLTSAPTSPGMAVWNGDRPKDVLIQNNRFVKEPVSLANMVSQYGYSSKGHIELKVGLRTTINANTFEGYHLAFVFTPRNQSTIAEGGGKEVWSTLDETVFSNNWVKAAPGTGQVFGIQLEDETCTVQPGSGVRVENNLFESGTKMVNIGASKNVQFIHNTFTGNAGLPTDTDQVVFNYGAPSTSLLMRDNIFYNNNYGLNCQISPGTQSTCWPGLGMSGNVIVDNRTSGQQVFQGPLSSQYPTGNYFSSTLGALSFVDPSNGNWRLSASSSYKSRATDGTDPGVNMDTLMTALGSSYNPVPNPNPTPVPSATPTPSPTPTPTPTPGPGGEVVWIEDSLPAGVTVGGDGETWNWASSNPAPYLGTSAHQSANVAGLHQHYFHFSPTLWPVNTNENLFVYVWIDPAAIPSEIMVQWKDLDTAWEHRAYWGSNNITLAANGTVAQQFVGAIPPAGQWVRLEVPASWVGLEGKTVNGMSFTLYGGRVAWDHAGKASSLTGPNPIPTPTPTPTPTPIPTPTPVPSPTPTPVVVNITSPTTNSTISVGGSVTIKANASGGSITKVTFAANSNTIGSTSASPYNLAWSNMSAGTYSVTATAQNTEGTTKTSSPVTIKVSKALKGVRNGKNSTNTINNTLTQGPISLANTSGQTNALLKLVTDIDQTYRDFVQEKAMFSRATQIDQYLFAASFLARTGAALSSEKILSTGISDRLEKINSYLSFCEDLMVDGIISTDTTSVASRVNAQKNLLIGQPETGGLSSLTVLPNQTAKISTLATTPFSTETVTASNGGSYELGDVSVTIGGEEALILSVSPTELAVVAPSTLVGGVAEVIVSSREGFIHHGGGNVAGLNPTILGLADDTSGRGVVVDSFGSRFGIFQTTSSLLGFDGRTRLSILATGLSSGLVNTDQSNDIWLSNGQVLQNLAELVKVQAQTSDGRIFNLPVEYAGVQGTIRGIDQVNVILVPELAGAGNVQLRITAGGVTSPAKTIFVN